MLALSDRALESVRGVAFVGELRLAITDYFLPSSIADLLKKLRVRYPHLRRHVSVRNSMQIESGADSGEFDIGLSMRILDGRRSAGRRNICRYCRKLSSVCCHSSWRVALGRCRKGKVESRDDALLILWTLGFN